MQQKQHNNETVGLRQSKESFLVLVDRLKSCHKLEFFLSHPPTSRVKRNCKVEVKSRSDDRISFLV